MAVVACGHGSRDAADEAAALVVRTALEHLRTSPAHDPEHAAACVGQALVLANEALYTRSSIRHGLFASAGVVLAFGDSVAIAHVGVVRALRWRNGVRNGVIETLTLDHVLENDPAWVSVPEEDQARGAGRTLTRMLGHAASVKPDIQCVSVIAGDRILLVTHEIAALEGDIKTLAGIGDLHEAGLAIVEAGRSPDERHGLPACAICSF